MRSNDVLIFNKILEILTKIRYSMLKPGGGLWHNSPLPLPSFRVEYASFCQNFLDFDQITKSIWTNIL